MNKRQKEVVAYQLKSEKDVLKELEWQYDESLNGIDQQILEFQQMHDSPSKVYRIEYQRRMKQQVEAQLELLHSNNYQTIDQYLRDVYTNGYVGTMYDLHGQNIPVIAPIDPKSVIRAVTLDSQLKEPLYESLGVDVKHLKKTISSEISRGITSGLLFEDIARNVHAKTKAPLSRAKTIVRTEGHRIQEASAEDARQVAKSKGADVVKQWDATLDGKTRENHRLLDGQIPETDEYFEIGSKRAMYPGDFGDPAEDCNCRCVALTRARKALDADELKTMQERARFFGLLADDSKEFGHQKEKNTFAGFKKKYLKASETVENSGKSGIIEAGGTRGKSGALTSKNDPKQKRRKAHAETYYSSVRNSDKQSIVNAISRNTGIDIAEVDRAITHVFYSKHNLDKGYDFFDSDYDMAESIRRLRLGFGIQEHDLILIHHEAMEADLMHSGMSYDEAHLKTSERYNYKTALDKFLAENGLE